MRKFTIVFGYTVQPIKDTTWDVLLSDYNKSIGKCYVTFDGSKTIGQFDLEEDVAPDMYVYYRYNEVEKYFYAIQLLDEPLLDKPAKRISEVLLD